jgi:hypothetical protein
LARTVISQTCGSSLAMGLSTKIIQTSKCPFRLLIQLKMVTMGIQKMLRGMISRRDTLRWKEPPCKSEPPGIWTLKQSKPS